MLSGGIDKQHWFVVGKTRLSYLSSSKYMSYLSASVTSN